MWKKKNASAGFLIVTTLLVVLMILPAVKQMREELIENQIRSKQTS